MQWIEMDLKMKRDGKIFAEKMCNVSISSDDEEKNLPISCGCVEEDEPIKLVTV